MQEILEILCGTGTASILINFVLLLISELLALSKCDSNGILDHILKMVRPISKGVLLVEGSSGLDDSIQLSGALSELVAEKSVDPSD